MLLSGTLMTNIQVFPSKYYPEGVKVKLLSNRTTITVGRASLADKHYPTINETVFSIYLY